MRAGRSLSALLLLVAMFAAGAQMAGMPPQPSAVKPAAPLPPGVAAMEARLRAIYAGTDWKADPSKPGERARYLEAALRSGQLTAEQKRVVLPELATEQLRAGDVRGSLATLKSYEELLSTTATPASGEQMQLHHLRAMAYLRLGETENCADMHTAHSCVFPLRGAGVHKLPEGAEGAQRELIWLLQHDGRDALSRWLLNVTAMQLGRYPQAVPKAWLLPPSLYRSEAEIGAFEDAAPLAGVDVMGHAGGVLVEDFDGDGLLDIVTSSSGPLDPMHLFHNNGDGSFSDWSERSGLSHELGGLNLVATDYDNDGRPDILVLRGGWWGKFGMYPLSLLHNRGDGTFEDVTERAGLLHAAPTQTAAWADFDNDGWLDLFVGYESTPGNAQPSRLYRNNHDGTFTDVSATAMPRVDAFVKGVAWGDFNNDGRPDLYVSVREGRNMLLRNDGAADPAHPDGAHWKWTNVAAQAGVVPQGNTFATWFFDYDNDGWPDIFVAGYWTGSMEDVGRFEAGESADVGLPHLYHNNHDGTFTDVAHAMHLDRAALTMGANFGELENSGWLSVYLGTGDPNYEALLPNRMFRNDRGERFEDITTSGGFGHLQKGHAVAFADLENRGQEDVFEEMGGAFVGDAYESSLYRNPGHAGHSITLRLQGVQSNRAAYGARVDVEFRENGRTRHVYRTVGAVSSFGGNPTEQHIGCGAATVIERVSIRWPATPGHEQVLEKLTADRVYRVVEGQPAQPVERPAAFVLGAHGVR